MIKVALTSLGCKVNQCDGAEIGQALSQCGMSMVPFGAEADIYIINTCTVTHKTDYQSRQLIRRARRRNPDSRVLVTGCYAETKAAELEKIPGVSLVIPNQKKDQIPKIIMGIFNLSEERRDHDQTGNKGETAGWANLPGHTRAFLKIQDGCDSFCAYCIVPYTRGEKRSLPLRDVEKRIYHFGRSGRREIVLTGIHLGAYGQDLRPRTSLLDLVKWASEKRPVERLRLSSIEPTEIPDDITDYMKEGGILCPHLHIPLQSGDNLVLKAMGRVYDAAFFEDRLKRLYRALPHIAIGVDVLAGFPGEDEQAFRNTMELLTGLPLAYLHVFPFSGRPGTRAFSMAGQVADKVKNERARALRNLGRKKREEYMKMFLGRELSVLMEGEGDTEGFMKGLAENYLVVMVKDVSPRLKGCIVKVVPQYFLEGILYGEITDHCRG